MVGSLPGALPHVPVAKHPSEQLEEKLLNGLSYATEKLAELTLLKEGLTKGVPPLMLILTKQRQALLTLKEFAKGTNADLTAERNNLSSKDFKRPAALKNAFVSKTNLLSSRFFQQQQLAVSRSLPEVRSARQKWRKNEWTDAEYDEFIKKETKRWIDIQEEIGLDVLVHGEFERTDMVEYFGEKLAGFAFTKFAWVQSYGSRRVKPPIIYGDVEFTEPMTVKETVYAQSLTEKKSRAC